MDGHEILAEIFRARLRRRASNRIESSSGSINLLQEVASWLLSDRGEHALGLLKQLDESSIAFLLQYSRSNIT